MFDAINLHAYWSSAGFTQWNALRWRQKDAQGQPVFPKPPGLKLFVSECGRDRVRDGPDGTYIPTGGPPYGWKNQGITEETYIGELLSYNRELLNGIDEWGTPFTSSPTSDWDSFQLPYKDYFLTLTRLGLHDRTGGQINPATPEFLAWAQNAPIVKSVSSTAAIRSARQDAYTIYRWQFDEVTQSRILDNQDVDYMLNTILAGLAGFTHPNLYLELLNEVGKGRRQQYIDLSLKAIARLHDMGYKVCGPCWATGDYEREDWLAFFPEQQGVKVPIDYGPRKKTLGSFVHSSRGAWKPEYNWNEEEEFDRTVAYLSTSDQASANVVIGQTRTKEIVPGPNGTAHGRGPVNFTHKSYELTQSKPTVPYVLRQYKELAKHLVEDAAVYGWPLIRVKSQTQPGYIAHEDSQNGKQDGKSDPGVLFDWNILSVEIKKLVQAPFDIKKEWEKVWAIADNVEAHGHPWYGQGLKANTTLSKGEK